MINWIEVMRDLQADGFWVSEFLVTPKTIKMVMNHGNASVEVFISTETNKIVGSRVVGSYPRKWRHREPRILKKKN